MYGAAFLVFQLCLILAQIRYSGYFSTLYNLITLGVLSFCVQKFYVYYLQLITIKDIEKNPAVMKIKADMKEAEKGNDYLNELIDRL